MVINFAPSVYIFCISIYLIFVFLYTFFVCIFAVPPCSQEGVMLTCGVTPSFDLSVFPDGPQCAEGDVIYRTLCSFYFPPKTMDSLDRLT